MTYIIPLTEINRSCKPIINSEEDMLEAEPCHKILRRLTFSRRLRKIQFLQKMEEWKINLMSLN